MATQAQTTGFVVTADINPFKNAMAQMSGIAKGTLDNVGKQIAGVGGIAGVVRTQLGALTAALSVTAMAAFAKGVYAGAAALDDMAEVTGSTVEKLSMLQSVAKVSGFDINFVADSMVKLTRNMNSAGEEGKAITRALNFMNINIDEFRRLDPSDRMMLLAKRMSDASMQGSRTALALDLMGKSGAQMIPYLMDLAETGELHAKVTAKQAAQAELFEKSLNKLSAASASLGKSVALGILPGLSKIADEMARAVEAGGKLAGIWVLLRRISPLGFMMDMKDGYYDDPTEKAKKIVDKQRGIVDFYQSEIVRLEVLVQRGDKAAVRELDTARGKLAAAQESLTLAKKSLSALETAPVSGSKADPYKGGNAGKAGDENARMQQWEAELAQRKLKLQEQAAAEGTFREMSKAEELAYWKEIAARRDLTEKESLTLRKKVAEESMAIRKDEFETYVADLKTRQEAAREDYTTRIRLAEETYQAIVQKYGAESKQAKQAMGDILQERRKLADQTKQIEEMRIQAVRERAGFEIEQERQIAQLEFDLGQITRAQLLQKEMEFEQRKYEIQLQGLRDRLALVDPTRDPVAYEQASLQIEEAERQHQVRMAGIRSQLKLDQSQGELNMFNGMEQGFQQMVSSIGAGAQSLRDILQNTWRSISGTFFNEIIAKPMAQFAARVVRETVLYKMLASAQAAMAAWASGATIAAKAVETEAVVGMEATKAAAGGAASQAGIPIAGPALAVAAAAAMMALVIGLGNKGPRTTTTTTSTRLPSAAGGWVVPRGVNPLAQLHEEEMVLPRKIASPLQAMLQGDGEAMPGRIGGDTYHVSIVANDARSFGQMLKDNPAELAAAFANARRRGYT